MKAGDTVRIDYEGRTVIGNVSLASENGRSLMLAWDDRLLGGYAGQMPVLMDERGHFHDLIEGKLVKVTKVNV